MSSPTSAPAAATTRFRMAELVGPKGKVLAVDIQPEMLDLIRKRMKAKASPTSSRSWAPRPTRSCRPAAST